MVDILGYPVDDVPLEPTARIDKPRAGSKTSNSRSKFCAAIGSHIEHIGKVVLCKRHQPNPIYQEKPAQIDADQVRLDEFLRDELVLYGTLEPLVKACEIPIDHSH